MWDWIWGILRAFGLWRKRGKLLMLGLDNAGKTTLLHVLREGRVAQHAPTQRTTHEELACGTVLLVVFDIGGHKDAREAWADYYVGAAGILYLIDASDPKRFQESKEELDALLTAPGLAGVPVAVLGNKIDLPGAVSEANLRARFGLVHTTGKTAAPIAETRPIEVFMTSVLQRHGCSDAVRWLAEYVEDV